MTIAEATEITLADVEAIGDVDDALRDFYDQQVAAAAAATGVAERTIRDWVEHDLITDGGFRGQALRGPIGGDGADVVPMTLQNGHLLRAESRRGTNWYEIAHDRMVEPILASNAAWRATNLNPLQVAAIDWNAADRPAAMLLTGVALDEARTWAEANETAVSQIDHEFLAESDAAAAAILLEGRRRRRNRALLTAAVVAALLAGIAVVVAMSANNRLSKAESDADVIRAQAAVDRGLAEEQVQIAETNLEEKQAEADEIAASLDDARATADRAQEDAASAVAAADAAQSAADAAQARAENAEAEAEAAVEAELAELERLRAEDIALAEQRQQEAEGLRIDAELAKDEAAQARAEATKAQEEADAAQADADEALAEAARAQAAADEALALAEQVAADAADLQAKADAAEAAAQADLERLADLEAELEAAELDKIAAEAAAADAERRRSATEADALRSLFTGLVLDPGPGAIPGSICTASGPCTLTETPRPGAVATPLARVGNAGDASSDLFVATVKLGDGRAVVYGHDGILLDVSVNNSAATDNVAFLDNAARWAMRPSRRPGCSSQPRIVILRGFINEQNTDRVQALFARRGWGTPDVVSPTDSTERLDAALSCADLVIHGNDHQTGPTRRNASADAQRLADFVNDGGGLLVGGLGWAFGGDWNDYPVNRVASTLGVAFSTDTFPANTLITLRPE